MNKYIFIFLLSISYVFGGFGTSGFEFLRTDFSPRASAMAGTCAAMRSDINGVFHNPAGLASIQKRQFMLNFTKYLLDINGGNAGYSQRVENIGQLSAMITYFDYGVMDETTEEANPTGRKFGSSDFAFAVSLSDNLDDYFAYGVTVKYVHSTIQAYNASAIAFDFGLIYEAPFGDDLFLGISALNFGQTINAFIKTKEDLPSTISIGISKKLAHLPLVLNANLNYINEDENDIMDRLKKFSIGGEFTLSSKLRLRLGYNNDLHDDLETINAAGLPVSLSGLVFCGINSGLIMLFPRWVNWVPLTGLG